MAKFDIKDVFWRLDCQEGQEWNFVYVMPQKEGETVRLVVPTSLQMGWIESPPFFCAASGTGRDVAEQYVETPIGSRPRHKFEQHTKGDTAYNALPECSDGTGLSYMVEVYVDDFISLAIPTKTIGTEESFPSPITITMATHSPTNTMGRCTIQLVTGSAGSGKSTY